MSVVVCVNGCVSVLCVCVCMYMCLWGTYAAFLLVEHANRKAAAVSLTLDSDPVSLRTGLDSVAEQ